MCTFGVEIKLVGWFNKLVECAELTGFKGTVSILPHIYMINLNIKRRRVCQDFVMGSHTSGYHHVMLICSGVSYRVFQ